MNIQSDPTFTLNGLRIRFNVNNARFPSNVDLCIEKESLDNNSVCFNISVKPKSTEEESLCERILVNEPVIADNNPIVESNNHVECSKSRVSFKANPNTFLLTEARSFSDSSISSSVGSTFSQVSGLTNIFKQESSSLIPLKKNKVDSQARLFSRTNVGVVESLKDTEMDAEEAIETAEVDKGENAERKILRRNEKDRVQSNESTAARCECVLKSMKNNLIEVLHNMEFIQSKIESLQNKNR